ncbi:MAG: hypothetical protein IPN29_20835 [Saprospiraceae bacterium]|nr:hypothetical protein [Saprospiraceae bacterium]
MKNKLSLLYFTLCFIIIASCSTDQISVNSNSTHYSSIRSSGVCGCTFQLPDENDPCCYRIKCDYDRYIVIGIDGCDPAGSGYNYYTILGSFGTIGNYTTICSPYGGLVMLYIHDSSGRCGAFNICDLFPSVCSDENIPECGLDNCD